MVDKKLTALDAIAAPDTADLIYVVDDPGGTPTEKKATLNSGILGYMVNGGRLTLTTGVPVTTADVSGATTLYWTPYIGGWIGLYDGTNWIVLPSTEKSLSLIGYTASKPYDIFGYNDSGTLALESLIWTDNTTRATALTTQDGILVKTGATTRRYLGTIYINATGGQTEDTVMQRFVWNYYNRVLRRLYLTEETSHTYNSTTVRYWNNSSFNRVELVRGVGEDVTNIAITGFLKTTVDGSYAQISVGIDVNNNWDSEFALVASGVTEEITPARVGNKQIGIGFHYIAAVERAPGGQNSTFDLLRLNVMERM